jgi:hypothetical protein
MKKPILLLVLPLAMFLAACGRQAASVVVTRPPLTVSPSPTSGESPHPCAYTWATQPLPELSAKIQTLLDAEGIKGATVSAEAYGENCYDSQVDKVVGFGVMETDFRFTIPVDDPSNKTRLGETVARLLKIINAIPTNEIPGPNRGYIGITFESSKGQVNMWFMLQDGITALNRGLTGADLFEQLLKK